MLAPGEGVWRAGFSLALNISHVAPTFRAEWEAFVIGWMRPLEAGVRQDVALYIIWFQLIPFFKTLLILNFQQNYNLH